MDKKEKNVVYVVLYENGPFTFPIGADGTAIEVFSNAEKAFDRCDNLRKEKKDYHVERIAVQ